MGYLACSSLRCCAGAQSHSDVATRGFWATLLLIDRRAPRVRASPELGRYVGGMIPRAVTDRILGRLDALESAKCVRILLAVESGSRAWGFPSLDSDYDVRFVYVRPLDDYLAIEPRRDVIECPIEGDLDLSGWDIQKALRLLLKANPALNEWLVSPVRYRWQATVADRLRTLAGRTPYRRTGQHHYLGLGHSIYQKYIHKRETVALKKYFYVVRPVMALRWLRTRTDPPPMRLSEIRAGIAISPGADQAVGELIARKAATRELGTGPRIPALDRMIEDELAKEVTAPRRIGDPQLLADANLLFRDVVRSQD